jgi:hypothetical protein
MSKCWAVLVSGAHPYGHMLSMCVSMHRVAERIWGFTGTITRFAAINQIQQRQFLQGVGTTNPNLTPPLAVHGFRPDRSCYFENRA